MSFIETHFKKIVFLMAFALVISVSLSSAKATGVDPQSEEFKQKQEVIEKALVIENGTYKIDTDKTDGQLTKSEINQINLFFKNVDPEKLAAVAKLLDGNDFSVKWLPVAVVAFLAGLAAFVGWELAAKITEDFYTWGVTSACKKWKDVGVVKSFCKANGYL
ncbi:hypothetical protein ACSQ7W_00035 [Bacillus halotolerans]|uniref:hypothetical protein n=1 Tax=Bacillus halotolerans TaxID=260554 RepID=UPI00192C77EF|nr:hypothetical protein [Bacillus halotolerans]MBL4966682.1 hypothetical protein [Bacillus halotolerans]HEB7549501.1 hypothetical protein [Campylobacter coli]HEB7570721.1 hypothetical protein [Campylobacter coli]